MFYFEITKGSHEIVRNNIDPNIGFYPVSTMATSFKPIVQKKKKTIVQYHDQEVDPNSA